MLKLIESLTKKLNQRFDAESSKPRLTPMNILVGKRGHFIDLNIDNGSGDPHYLAPEEINGQENGFAGWIYNIGAIFYYVATGKKPFGQYNPEELETSHLNQKLPDPLSMRPDLSKQISAMIMKMMLPIPEQRHKSLTSFNLDMDNLHKDEWPINAPVPINAAQSVNEELVDKKSRHTPSNAQGKKRKRVAVSNQQIDSARKRHRSTRRKISGGEFFYILLVAGALWAAWHYHFEDLWLEYNAQQASPYQIENTNNEIDRSERRIDTPASREDPVKSQNRPQTKPKKTRVEIRDREYHQTEDNQEQTSYRKENSQPKSNVEQQNRRPSTRPPEKKKVWNDPEFLKGARMYNNAVKLYKAYATEARKGKTNRRMLDRIENNAQQAATYFRSCRGRAPDNVPIQKYLNNCYRLIADCRQSKLLNMAN